VKTLWKAFKIVGYIILGIFGVNLGYVLFLYSVRHEGWSCMYNPNLGSHTNVELAWQIIWSIIAVALSMGLIHLSKKKLKAINQKGGRIPHS